MIELILLISLFIIFLIIAQLTVELASGNIKLSKLFKNISSFKKKRLLKKVNIYIPKDNSKAIESALTQKENEYDKRCDINSLCFHKSKWQKYIFKPKSEPIFQETTDNIYNYDLQKILLPNENLWTEVESELISKGFSFPGEFTSSELPEYSTLKPLNLILEKATFDYSNTKLSEKKIKKVFADEFEQVKTYNANFDEKLIKIKNINKKISAFNACLTDKLKELEESSSNEDLIEREKFEVCRKTFLSNVEAQQKKFSDIKKSYLEGKQSSVVQRFSYILESIELPKSIPKVWNITFDLKDNILLVEIKLPNVVVEKPLKKVELKSGIVDKNINKTEEKNIIPKFHPALLLRYAFEIFRNDFGDVINALVLNGWINHINPANGIKQKVYTASLLVEKSDIIDLNLPQLDPLYAFQHLKGKSAGKLIEIVPINPILKFSKEDNRFITTNEIIDSLHDNSNLASMDWQDFESLIAELFEKEFGNAGAEVKVTQASRDRGVDAVIFDPDPVRGGKIIVQAKRYTNTVEVSAVRDLCAVVKKEGANKGILVTTSTFGIEAYKFANNEPVTLLNGSELLGLLKKHGYNFKINLQEAKNLLH